tara:strand:- start:1069 stop:1965 length:897 start_codon:yes stop_codon:yes gene_type:complete
MKSLKPVENRGSSITIDLSSIDNKITFVRTGIKNSRSFFESVLYCCIAEFKNLNNQEKTDSVNNLYKIMCNHNKNLDVRKISSLFYKSKKVLLNNSLELFDTKYNDDIYSFIFDLIQNEKLFNMTNGEETKFNIIKDVKTNFEKLDTLKTVENSGKKKLLNVLESMLNDIIKYYETNKKNRKINDINSEIVNAMSDYFDVDIYFIDSCDKNIYTKNGQDIGNRENFIIILKLPELYEPIGQYIKDENRILRKFDIENWNSLISNVNVDTDISKYKEVFTNKNYHRSKSRSRVSRTIKL